MSLKQVTPSTISLILAGIFLLCIGTYTTNGGFQLAGALILAVGLILGVGQAGKRRDKS